MLRSVSSSSPLRSSRPSSLRPVAAGSALLLALVLAACHGSVAKSPESDPSKAAADGAAELQDATTVLRELQAMPEGVPAAVREHARCVAIIPNVVKAAIVVGGRWGRGVASCRTASSWSAPAFFELGGGSVGVQIGVQSTDLVIYVMNDNGMRRLLTSRVELGAAASVAAGPVGREASAGTDWTLRAELLTYSRSRGLFVGINLGGAVLTQDSMRTEGVYGAPQDYRELLEGNVPAPSAASGLIAELAIMGRAAAPKSSDASR